MTATARNILFVCTGNICRSPMAEYIFRHRMSDVGNWQTASAGTMAANGIPASTEAVKALADRGIDLAPHRSQCLTRELADAATYVVCMTEGHRTQILQSLGLPEERVRLLTSFGTAAKPVDIADPIGGTLDVYRRTRDQIESAMADLILHLVEQDQARPVAASTGMRTAIGCDHAGYELKQAIMAHLTERGVEVEDEGCFSSATVDYPDVAAAVAVKVSRGTVDQGLLICTTGIGMDITANRFPRVRAALCREAATARMARTHNNANVLVLGSGGLTPEAALKILDAWCEADFERGGRHERRVDKIRKLTRHMNEPLAIYETDPEIYSALNAETERQNARLDLVPSENYVSRAVLEATGSSLTNKYAGGYAGRRWYLDCEHVDEVERLAVERACELFGAEHANVQPYCGSSANLAVMQTVMKPGDVLLAMNPAHGGHVTHGHESHISGRLFKAVHYGLHPDTEQINYDEVTKLAKETRPKLIVAGASFFSRLIDYQRFRKIADSVGAYLVADMAHVAGLVAGDAHPSPVPHAHFVTSSTHKTLRGPRGGLILCEKRYAEDLDRMVFPGLQGGPLMHVVAAKAVCLLEASTPEFGEYAQQVILNARALAEGLQAHDLRIVSGGTDNHLMVVDLTKRKMSGKDAAAALLAVGIVSDAQALPFEESGSASGLRIGTPAITTRGMGVKQMAWITDVIVRALEAAGDATAIKALAQEVSDTLVKYPIPF